MIGRLDAPLSEIAGKTLFGMVLDEMPSDIRCAEELPDLPPELAALELPLDFFEFHKGNECFQQLSEDYDTVVSGNFLDPAVARNLVYASESIFHEFRSYTEKILSAANKAGAKVLTFDPDMNQIMANGAKARSVLLRLLREIFPILNDLGTTLLIPFSIPAKEEALVFMNGFLKESMIPNLKLRLDVHPHEFSREMTPGQAAGKLLHEVRSIHFCYAASSGNTLVADHLIPFLRKMSVLGFRGPYFASPGKLSSKAALLAEAENYAKIIRTLQAPEQKEGMS